MSLLLDIGQLTQKDSDHALEIIHKAIGDADDSLWDKHPSPFVRKLVELFTQRGLTRIGGFQKDLAMWLDGSRYEKKERPPRPDGSMYRWTPEELQLVRVYLSSLSPAEFTLDDHMMLVDYLVQRYLPENDLRTEAEWLTTRAMLMGRVQANMEKASESQIDTILKMLPTTVGGAEAQFVMSVPQRASLMFATNTAADRVQRISEDARYRMRRAISHHIEQQYYHIPGTSLGSLQTKLMEEFATLNRDWRRIAVTEAGNAANEGMITSLSAGSKVRRIEQYRGACQFCRKIDGKVFEIVPSSMPNKDGETQVWPGKSNIGRSAAASRRVGDKLVPRAEYERLWCPAGTVHPNCRGRWNQEIQDREGDDKDFGDWLRRTLGNKS